MNYKGLCNQTVTVVKSDCTSTVLNGCYFETSKKYTNNIKGRIEMSDPFCIIPTNVLDIKPGDKIILGEITEEITDYPRFNPVNMMIVSDIAYKYHKNKIVHIELR